MSRRRTNRIIRVIQSDTEDEDDTEDFVVELVDDHDEYDSEQQGLVEGTHYVLGSMSPHRSGIDRSSPGIDRVSPNLDTQDSFGSSLFAPDHSQDSASSAQTGGAPSESSSNTDQMPVRSETTEASSASSDNTENVPAIPPSINNAPDPTMTPPNTKKRKLSDHDRTPVVGQNLNDTQDFEEGLCCPICLEYWETHGPHRLVSLKCGHLFGESCIRRWISESAANKCCPQCKSKCTARDFRYLYAKRVRAIDRSEEHELRKQLDKQKGELEKLRTTNSSILLRETLLMKKFEAAQLEIRQLKSCTNVSSIQNSTSMVSLRSYRLSLEKNLEMSKESMCRVMTSNKSFNQLLVSQKQATNMFAGFGVRFVDVMQSGFRQSTFLHTSSKSIRDIALSSDGELMACASQENKIKLYDLNCKNVIKTYNATEGISVWTCAISATKTDFFVGTQNGKVFNYDIRGGENFISELSIGGDMSPVINVAIIPKIPGDFPFGGLIVCKLTSAYIFEFISSSGEAKETKLALQGPFCSMTYNQTVNKLLISTKINKSLNEPQLYHYGQITKVDGIPIFENLNTFRGSTVTPQMSRCAMIPTSDNTLLAGYQHDTKSLNIYDTERKIKTQALPVSEVVLDTCGISFKDSTFIGGLSEQKVRIYKVNSSNY